MASSAHLAEPISRSRASRKVRLQGHKGAGTINPIALHDPGHGIPAGAAGKTVPCAVRYMEAGRRPEVKWAGATLPVATNADRLQ